MKGDTIRLFIGIVKDKSSLRIEGGVSARLTEKPCNRSLTLAKSHIFFYEQTLTGLYKSKIELRKLP